jgi:aspartyl-tRNA synthetase
MSFVEQKDVFDVVENYIFDVVSKYSDKKILENKIFSMTHAEATEKYGSDKPDLRYDMKLIDVIDIFERSTNEIFLGIAKDKEKNRIKAIKVTN